MMQIHPLKVVFTDAYFLAPRRRQLSLVPLVAAD